MDFLLKITPNNKTVILNLDVIINGYDDVPHVPPTELKEQGDFILDPCTMQYVDTEVKEQERVYPIAGKLKLLNASLVPWYGCTYLYNSGKDSNLKLEILNDRIHGIFNCIGNNSEVQSFDFDFFITWSDGISHYEELKETELVNINENSKNNLSLFYLDGPLFESPQEINPSPIRINHKTGYIAKIYAYFSDGKGFSVSGYDTIEIWQKAYPGDDVSCKDVSGIYPLVLDTWFPTFDVSLEYLNPGLYLSKNISTYQIKEIAIYGQKEYTYEGTDFLFHKYGCDDSLNITNKVKIDGLVIENRYDDGTFENLKDFVDTYGLHVTNDTSLLIENNGMPLVINGTSTNIGLTSKIVLSDFKYIDNSWEDENGLSINASILDPSELNKYVEFFPENGSGQNIGHSVLQFKKGFPGIDIKLHYSGKELSISTFEDLLEKINLNNIYGSSKKVSKKSKKSIDNELLYGTHTTDHTQSYRLTLTIPSKETHDNYSISKTTDHGKFLKYLKLNLRINGVLVNDITNIHQISEEQPLDSVINSVYPGIYTISVDKMPEDIEGILNIDLSGKQGLILFTNDENQKNLDSYINVAKDINKDVESFMLLRTNPKLTGNMKLVVDSSNNLYLDTFKVSQELSKQQYRKYPISYEGNYPRDIKECFGSIQLQELFKVPEQSMDAHRYYTRFEDQYLTNYEYGAETNDDNLYSENMRILAPLHIGKSIPEFFAIFRYDETYNKETYNQVTIDNTLKFKELLENSKVVKTFDLRTYTSIGQYLNNYQKMLHDYIYGQVYLQFIEQDNNEYSNYYRQGKNNWKGILVDKGILGYKSEISYFISKQLDKKEPNTQEVLNDYIINGYERNNIIYPNILNLEFMFNDPETENYSMHRYFGLYLTLNDVVNYECMIKDDPLRNEVVIKLDASLNKSIDEFAIQTITADKYKDRIFYAITNDAATRVLTRKEIKSFFNENVVNKPLINIHNIYAEPIEFKKLSKSTKSFMTLTLDNPIEYGEHIKIVVLNRPLNDKSVSGTVRQTKLTEDKRQYVFDIIASNNPDLATCYDCINPYVNTQKSLISGNTYYYRITFYTQDKEDPNKLASVKELIYRISKCIKKFNKNILTVGSYNDSTISILSDSDETYLQHIAKVNLGELLMDYSDLKYYSTDTSYNSYKHVDFFNHFHDGSTYLNLKGISSVDETAYQFIDYTNPKNFKEDNIKYFNKNITTIMRPLSNQTDLYDTYYIGFSNEYFEVEGWRFLNIVKFIKVSDLSFPYGIYEDVEESLKDVPYPLVYTKEKDYLILDKIDINSGYINCKLADKDTQIQKINFDKFEYNTIINPFNVNDNMINSYFEVQLNNSNISLYKPKKSSLAVMGISNIKDIDTTVELERNIERTTLLSVKFKKGEKVMIDESDYRILQGVVYNLISGGFEKLPQLNKGDNFIIVGKTLYVDENERVVTYTLEDQSLTALGNDTEIAINSRQRYQKYAFKSEVPNQLIKMFFKDPENIDTTELNIPIVPQVNCIWKSNGTYLDANPTLDTDKLINRYDVQGCYTENTYTPAEFLPNQYVINKIEDTIKVNGESMSFEDAILNNKCEHIIKQLLIEHVNIKPAIGYYNADIQTFEFIFNGTKFVMKVSDRYYQLNIHLNEYNNYEVFVLNEYDMSKNNKVYISTNEEFILFVNHSFYIDYAREADNDIISLDSSIIGYAKYSSNYSPYELMMKTLTGTTNSLLALRTNDSKSIYDMIDPLNMWSSYFIQYDTPLDSNTKPAFIYNSLTTLLEFADLIGFMQVQDPEPNHSIIQFKTALLNTNKLVSTPTGDGLHNVEETDPWAYFLTKADGEYNTANETGRIRLLRYANSFDVDTDYYIISENSYEEINSTKEKLKIILTVTTPNKIKYNFGYFTPNTLDISDFNIDDKELGKDLKINLIQANTSLKNINNILTYTGNKVYSNNRGFVTNNYFVQYNKSPLSSNWDRDFYREYKDEINFDYYNGYLTGIDDKSFFGSRCMTLHYNYILIDEWNPSKSTNILKAKQVDSTFNVNVINILGTQVTLNITLAIYNYFLNNDVFMHNWNELYSNSNIAIKNYIDLTMSRFFNLESGMELILYKKDDYKDSNINILERKPKDLQKWDICENIESKFYTLNNELYLDVKVGKINNLQLYPALKIYRK